MAIGSGEDAITEIMYSTTFALEFQALTSPLGVGNAWLAPTDFDAIFTNALMPVAQNMLYFTSR